MGIQFLHRMIKWHLLRHKIELYASLLDTKSFFSFFVDWHKLSLNWKLRLSTRYDILDPELNVKKGELNLVVKICFQENLFHPSQLSLSRPTNLIHILTKFEHLNFYQQRRGQILDKNFFHIFQTICSDHPSTKQVSKLALKAASKEVSKPVSKSVFYF